MTTDPLAVIHPNDVDGSGRVSTEDLWAAIEWLAEGYEGWGPDDSMLGSLARVSRMLTEEAVRRETEAVWRKAGAEFRKANPDLPEEHVRRVLREARKTARVKKGSSS